MKFRQRCPDWNLFPPRMPKADFFCRLAASRSRGPTHMARPWTGSHLLPEGSPSTRQKRNGGDRMLPTVKPTVEDLEHEQRIRLCAAEGLAMEQGQRRPFRQHQSP